jgi:hypothetical protein
MSFSPGDDAAFAGSIGVPATHRCRAVQGAGSRRVGGVDAKKIRLQSPKSPSFFAAALRQNKPLSANPGAERGPWSRRKALVCTNSENSEAVAKGLVAEDYDVFVADSTEEALGRMREDRIDVLILESNFDPVEQGYAFVTREVKLMRPL